MISPFWKLNKTQGRCHIGFYQRPINAAMSAGFVERAVELGIYKRDRARTPPEYSELEVKLKQMFIRVWLLLDHTPLLTVRC